MTRKGTLKVCSRGHTFYKSSDCPVCPKCWSGYYRKKTQSDFPEHLAAPALCALLNVKITSLSQLTKYTELELLDLYGMGPKALGLLRKALFAKGKSFSKK